MFGRIKTGSVIKLENNLIKRNQIKPSTAQSFEKLVTRWHETEEVFIFALRSLPTRCVPALPTAAPSWGRCLWLQDRTPGRPCHRLSCWRDRHTLPCLPATPPTAKLSEGKTLNLELSQWNACDEAILCQSLPWHHFWYSCSFERHTELANWKSFL